MIKKLLEKKTTQVKYWYLIIVRKYSNEVFVFRYSNEVFPALLKCNETAPSIPHCFLKLRLFIYLIKFPFVPLAWVDFTVCSVETCPAEVVIKASSQKQWRAVSAVSNIFQVFLFFLVIYRQ